MPYRPRILVANHQPIEEENPGHEVGRESPVRRSKPEGFARNPDRQRQVVASMSPRIGRNPVARP